MTVKKALKLITGVDHFYLKWDGRLCPVDCDDRVQIAAYGDFEVDTLYFIVHENNRETGVEIGLKMTPVRMARGKATGVLS